MLCHLLLARKKKMIAVQTAKGLIIANFIGASIW